MHHNITPWYNHLKARVVVKDSKVKLGGLVSKISSDLFTKEDKKEFNCDWTAVPCQSGEVRITQPHLPHGAKGPAKRVQRTMLPWYVALQTDLHHLEVHEGGTFEDLAKAHRDLIGGPRTPSGLGNKYGDIPYAFPATVPLMGLGYISDALVGRVKHDHATVKAEKELFLNGSIEDWEKYISNWRAKCIHRVMKA